MILLDRMGMVSKDAHEREAADLIRRRAAPVWYGKAVTLVKNPVLKSFTTRCRVQNGQLLGRPLLAWALITHRIEASTAHDNRSQGSGQQASAATVTGSALQA